MRYTPPPALKILAALVGAVSLSTCGLVTPPFPKYGSTAFRVEGNYAPVKAGSAMVINRDGAQLRVETTLPRLGRSSIVYERQTGAAYALAPPSAYTALAATAPPATSSRTGAPPNATSVAPLQPGVAGIAVRVADADAPQPFETYWASLGPDGSKSVGGCRIAGERGHLWRAREQVKAADQRTACVTNDGIVLQVRAGDRTVWEATKLQRGRQNASLFSIPANYQRFDPQAVAATQSPTTTTPITSLLPSG